jgi:hypothetical protein
MIQEFFCFKTSNAVLVYQFNFCFKINMILLHFKNQIFKNIFSMIANFFTKKIENKYQIYLN